VVTLILGVLPDRIAGRALARKGHVYGSTRPQAETERETKSA
jgi:hypothetical protein